MSLNRFKISEKHNLFVGKKHDHHVMHYFVLTLGLSTFALLMVYFQLNSLAQIVTAFFGTSFYAVWGIVHHYYEGRLTRLIALEYILISTVSFLLFFLVLS